jgi:hypothetical protein
MSDSQSPMGPGAKLRAQREAVLRVHLRGETEMDSDLVLSTMIDPPTYELPSIDVVLKGRDQVRQLLEAMFAAMPGIVHRPVTFHHADENVIVEVETDFPHGMDGSTPGRVATVKTIGVFPFDGEVSLGEKVYGDMSALLPHLTFLGSPADTGS